MARATAPPKVKSAAPGKAKTLAPGKKAPEKTDGKKTSGKKTSAGNKGTAPKMAAAPKKQATANGPVTNKAADLQRAGASKKAATPKKTGYAKAVERVVAVKTTASRRPATRVAVQVPAARRGRAPVAARKVPARRLGGAAGLQTFTVSHLNEADFKADGLRAYALYRDLGIAAATAGLCQAHVIRFVPPCTDEVRKRHAHSTELQLVYVLKGWIKNEFEGFGEQMMSAGSCWLQPSGIAHTVLDYSADCEVLEIIVPADFKTTD